MIQPKVGDRLLCINKTNSEKKPFIFLVKVYNGDIINGKWEFIDKSASCQLPELGK